MTAEPNRLVRAPTYVMPLRAPREAALPRSNTRSPWRLSQLALLLAELWLLVAVVVSAAGEGTFGLLFAGTALLWVLIAGVEAYETHERSAALKVRRQHTPRHAMPLRG